MEKVFQDKTEELLWTLWTLIDGEKLAKLFGYGHIGFKAYSEVTYINYCNRRHALKLAGQIRREKEQDERSI